MRKRSRLEAIAFSALIVALLIPALAVESIKFFTEQKPSELYEKIVYLLSLGAFIIAFFDLIKRLIELKTSSRGVKLWDLIAVMAMISNFPILFVAYYFNNDNISAWLFGVLIFNYVVFGKRAVYAANRPDPSSSEDRPPSK